jgi:hypothetical protein
VSPAVRLYETQYPAFGYRTSLYFEPSGFASISAPNTCCGVIISISAVHEIDRDGSHLGGRLVVVDLSSLLFIENVESCSSALLAGLPSFLRTSSASQPIFTPSIVVKNRIFLAPRNWGAFEQFELKQLPQ